MKKMYRVRIETYGEMQSNISCLFHNERHAIKLAELINDRINQKILNITEFLKAERTGYHHSIGMDNSKYVFLSTLETMIQEMPIQFIMAIISTEIPMDLPGEEQEGLPEQIADHLEDKHIEEEATKGSMAICNTLFPEHTQQNKKGDN
jgi:hypothetical protein